MLPAAPDPGQASPRRRPGQPGHGLSAGRRADRDGGRPARLSAGHAHRLPPDDPPVAAERSGRQGVAHRQPAAGAGARRSPTSSATTAPSTSTTSPPGENVRWSPTPSTSGSGLDPVTRMDPVTQTVKALLDGPTELAEAGGRVAASRTGTALKEGTKSLAFDDRNALKVPLNEKASNVGRPQCMKMAAQMLFTLRDLTSTRVEQVELQRANGSQLCVLDSGQAEAFAPDHASGGPTTSTSSTARTSWRCCRAAPRTSASRSTVPGPFGNGRLPIERGRRGPRRAAPRRRSRRTPAACTWRPSSRTSELGEPRWCRARARRPPTGSRRPAGTAGAICGSPTAIPTNPALLRLRGRRGRTAERQDRAGAGRCAHRGAAGVGGRCADRAAADEGRADHAEDRTRGAPGRRRATRWSPWRICGPPRRRWRR